MVSKANKSLKRGTSSWLQQFIDAVHMEEGENSTITYYKFSLISNSVNKEKQKADRQNINHLIIIVGLGTLENEEAAGDGTAVAEVATVKTNKWKEYTTHAITVFWRLVFAVIPPECKRCFNLCRNQIMFDDTFDFD